MEGSGFEDVLFQAGLCSSRSINGITGKHCNHCWLVHEAFLEALQRLRFCTKYSTAKVVQIIKGTCNVFIDNFKNISTNSSI